MRESEIEAYLVARVKDLGGEVRKVKWIGRRGAPDRLVMVGVEAATERLRNALLDEYPPSNAELLLRELIGMVSFWPELKAPGVKPEPHQLREHERMRRTGQRVEVVDSLERVDEVLR